MTSTQFTLLPEWKHELRDRSIEPLRRSLVGRWDNGVLALNLQDDGRFSMATDTISLRGSYSLTSQGSGYALELFDYSGSGLVFELPEIRRNALVLRPIDSTAGIELARAS